MRRKVQIASNNNTDVIREYKFRRRETTTLRANFLIKLFPLGNVAIILRLALAWAKLTRFIPLHPP